jgi:DNA-binding response OmpR family regulator
MSPDKTGIRVVCVGDDPKTIDLLTLILKRAGIGVTGTNGGRAGLSAIEQISPDLVLLDLMMPDGWEVYQSMKASAAMKHIPVIIITSETQRIDKELDLHLARGDSYITKPIRVADLFGSIGRALGGGDTPPLAPAPDPIVPPRPPDILTAGAKPEYDDDDLP